MKILVLNGSPKGKNSNTYCLTEAFLEGIRSQLGDLAQVTAIEVYRQKIEHCRGCFACWTSSPGKCVIQDDMEFILKEMQEASLVIWSFPLYCFGMPSKLKALLDRNLPLSLPFMAEGDDNSSYHPPRYDREPARNVLISTCGFTTRTHNYEALTEQCNILFGPDYTRILCPQGELFRHVELRKRTDEYLSYVRQAGSEYAAEGRIREDTGKRLEELLYPPDVFTAMADASWDISEKGTERQEGPGEQRGTQSAAERFTRQMAALYRPGSYDGTERVFEIYYTDVKECYQLVLGQEKCVVLASDFQEFTTRVETTLILWQGIAKGEYDGEQAMMEGKYRVAGDLKLLMAWEHYFGYGGSGKQLEKAAGDRREKKTNLSLMLVLWLIIWILLPVNPVLGAIAGICAAACIPFAGYRWELTVYDRISALYVTVTGLAVLLGADLQITVSLSYLGFGLMWLLSCVAGLPLSAGYSKNHYNGEYALRSPLFIKTNRILTICWGVLYLVTPVWTYFIMGSSMPYLTGAVNTLGPAALGFFTLWFQKWYPSRVASGRAFRNTI